MHRFLPYCKISLLYYVVTLPYSQFILKNSTYENTAARELQEEIGFAPGRLTYLGELRPYSKYFTTRSFVYLGRDLTASPLQGDEDYDIQQERIPLATFEQLIATGRLTDARIIAALYMARGFLQA